MSRAFVREDDQNQASAFPDRPISPHRNLVTPTGLAQIVAQLRHLAEAHSVAHLGGDREKLSEIARDIRYWSMRRATAQTIDPPSSTGHIQFGSTFTIEQRAPCAAFTRR